MPALARKSSPVADPTFYPVDDDMGEGVLHQLIASLLQALLQRFFSSTDRLAFVGVNTFLYWVQFHPEVTVAPDVYVMDGISPDVAPDNWKLWENGSVPSFVLEVVSKYPKKDYDTIHEKYADLGVPELVVFDPKAGRPRSKRVRWQVYRRIARRGFVKVEVSNEDRVFSKQLGLWLRVVGEGDRMRVRPSTGPRGDELLPTPDEIAIAEREARAAAEAKAEAERAARAAAEAELTRLRRELARLAKRRR
jgi:Uma2 family endonuclease